MTEKIKRGKGESQFCIRALPLSYFPHIVFVGGKEGFEPPTTVSA